MNIKSCEKKEKSIAELVIEVSPEEFDAAVGEAYRKNRGRISVPGFRKGKAPRGIIERMYGAEVFYNDALDGMMPGVLDFAVTETDLKIISVPEVADIDIKKDKTGVEITLTASLLPEVVLGQYKGLSARKPDPDVPESEIDKEIAAIRQRNARIEKVDRPAVKGDVAVIDYEGFIEGEPFEGGKAEGYELELGSISFIPGFEDKLQGMSAGEQRDLDLVFPESYAEHLAGKPVVFKVNMLEVREKQLPDLDDEFARDVSEFDTFDEYRQDVKDKQLKAKQTEADSVFENALLAKIAETMEADVPDVMIEQQMDDAMQNFARQVTSIGMDPSSYLQMMNTTPEEFRERSRAPSEKQVKVMLALEKIAELEGIEVSDDEIEEDYKEAAAHYGMEIEKIKESVQEDTILNDIKMRKAVKVVTDNATVDNSQPEEPDPESTDKPKAGQKKPGKISVKKQKKETADQDTETAELEIEAETQEAETAELEIETAEQETETVTQEEKGDESQ